jgi:hypothetical protein
VPKRNTLAKAIKAAAGRQNQPPATPQQPAASSKTKASKTKDQPATVLIGAHYAPEVRRTLLLVQAEPENTGKTLKQLLGEAINDLCAKYGKPQPYSGEE